MKLIQVRNKQTKAVSHVSEEWLERWPDDFDRVEPTDPEDPEEEPEKPVKRRSRVRRGTVTPPN